MGVPPTLISLFNDLYILVKSFPLFITDSSKVFRISIQLETKEVDFDVHMNIQPVKLL